MYIKSLSAILVFAVVELLTNSVFASAAGEVVPAYVFLPWPAVQSLVKAQINSTVGFTRELVNVSSEVAGIPITLPQVLLAGQVALVSEQERNATIINGSPLQLAVSLSDFVIATTLKRKIGNIDLNVSINARCSGAHLRLQGGALYAAIEWQRVNNFVDLKVENLKLAWQESDWIVEPPKCQGLDGLDAVTRLYILKELSRVEQFVPLVQQLVQDELLKKMTELKNQLATVMQLQVLSELVYYRTFGLVELGPQGLLFQVQASTRFAGIADKALLVDESIGRVDFSKFTQPTLLVSGDNLARLLGEVFAKARLSTEMKSIPAFKKLLGSWLLKLFLWPDLFSFSKSTDFRLLSQVLDNQLSFKILGTQQVQVSAQIGSWLMAPRAGEIWPYLYVNSEFASRGGFVVRESNLVINFINPQLEQKITFGGEYLKKFHPDTRIASSVLRKAILTQVQSQALVLPLPPLKLAEKDLQVRSFEADEATGLYYFGFADH